MIERPAVDASCLILLARVAAVDLLKLAGDRVVVPQAVAVELGWPDHHNEAVRTLRQNPWIEVVSTGATPQVILAWDLGAGESSVLGWALSHPGTQAIVDDWAARRCAAALNIPVRGTLGLVLAAKRRGVIPNARPLVEKLVAAGMYLSERVVNDALRLVDE